MKKLFAVLAILASLLTGASAGPATAVASPAAVANTAVVPAVAEAQPYSTVYARMNSTPGHHNNTFYSCTVQNRRAKIYIKYEINAVSGGDVQLEEVLYETAWGGHPAFLGNAVRADVMDDDPVWVEWSPAWGGSATSDPATWDDMPSYYNVLYLGKPALVMNTDTTNWMRIRFYGVGPGLIGGRCDDQYVME